MLDVPVTDNGSWYVQIGAFRESTNVDRMTGLLEQAGLRYKLVPAVAAEDTIMQVRVGGIQTCCSSARLLARNTNFGHSRKESIVQAAIHKAEPQRLLNNGTPESDLS